MPLLLPLILMMDCVVSTVRITRSTVTPSTRGSFSICADEFVNTMTEDGNADGEQGGAQKRLITAKWRHHRVNGELFTFKTIAVVDRYFELRSCQTKFLLEKTLITFSCFSLDTLSPFLQRGYF